MTHRMVLAVVVLGLLQGVRAFGQVEPLRVDADKVQGYKVARASYEKARKHFEKRDLDKTVKELESCLKRMPDFSDAHFLLAKVEYLEKRYAEALEHMERAKATFESSSALYYEAQGDRMQELQRLRDEQDVTLDNLRDALARATTDEQRRPIQSQIEQVQRTKDEIQRQLYEPPDEVVEMPADYHFFHGNILLRLNRLDDAAAQYREALKIKPDHADASNNLASLYLSAGHPKLALEVLEQAEAMGATVNAELKKAVLDAIR